MKNNAKVVSEKDATTKFGLNLSTGAMSPVFASACYGCGMKDDDSSEFHFWNPRSYLVGLNRTVFGRHVSAPFILLRGWLLRLADHRKYAPIAGNLFLFIFLPFAVVSFFYIRMPDYLGFLGISRSYNNPSLILNYDMWRDEASVAYEKFKIQDGSKICPEIDRKIRSIFSLAESDSDAGRLEEAVKSLMKAKSMAERVTANMAYSKIKDESDEVQYQTKVVYARREIDRWSEIIDSMSKSAAESRRSALSQFLSSLYEHEKAVEMWRKNIADNPKGADKRGEYVSELGARASSPNEMLRKEEAAISALKEKGPDFTVSDRDEEEIRLFGKAKSIVLGGLVEAEAARSKGAAVVATNILDNSMSDASAVIEQERALPHRPPPSRNFYVCSVE
ncbi:hypothetical protein J5J83_05265 [Azoarcus sp. L1K30]|uniref:hypothetical protein n=1 Tax=Azoarcus sp. L1K30 TaxID=2820277 RepID=UPI001B8381BE|nr:hypothetical protein [Azoarcus sp. L1K30]MBR0565526.1 hypothetical protein [Azoarcus sp. L1K30]